MIFFTQENITSQNNKTFLPFGTTLSRSYKGISYPGSIHYFLHRLIRLERFEFLIDQSVSLLNLSGKEEAPHLLLEIIGTKKIHKQKNEPMSLKVFSNFTHFPTQNSIAFKIKTEASKNISPPQYVELLSDEMITLDSLTLSLTAFRCAASGLFGANPDSFATLTLHITEFSYELETQCFFKHFKHVEVLQFNEVIKLLHEACEFPNEV